MNKVAKGRDRSCSLVGKGGPTPFRRFGPPLPFLSGARISLGVGGNPFSANVAFADGHSTFQRWQFLGRKRSDFQTPVRNRQDRADLQWVVDALGP